MKIIEEKVIEVTNFDLSYDGMYFIEYGEEIYRVYLPLNLIFEMVRIEGLSIDEVIELVEDQGVIHFYKVKMIIEEWLLESGQRTYPIMSISQYYLPEYFLILIGLDDEYLYSVEN